jgi:hypothetical protein
MDGLLMSQRVELIVILDPIACAAGFMTADPGKLV